jgi:hypothetical protein
MTQFSFGNDAKQIGRREWEDISGEWLNFLPDNPMTMPEEEVDDLPQLISVYQQTSSNKSTKVSLFTDIELFRQSIYLASVFYLQKATNIFNSACTVSAAGYRTWSRAISYQSAFFSMRSISLLLGCTVLRHKATNSYYQVDIWRASKESRSDPSESSFDIGFHKRQNPQHHDFWQIFVRLLHSTRISDEVWRNPIVDPLKMIDPESIPDIRNRLHYRASEWTYNDLLSRDTSDDLDAIQSTMLLGESVSDTHAGNFYFSLALQLLSMSISLFESIDNYGGVGKEPWEKIRLEFQSVFPFIYHSDIHLDND